MYQASMQRSRSSSLRRSAAVILALGLAASLFAAASGGRRARADFAFGNGGEVTTLDPAQVTGIPEGRVLRALFEGLTVKDPRTLEPLPGVAESWEISADGKRYLFHLRGDARWSNGDPVTAEDFALSWKRLLEPETAAEYAYQLWCVVGAKDFSLEPDPARRAELWSAVGIHARDERTLEVELEHPTPYFLALTAYVPLYPVHMRSLAAARARSPARWQIEWLRPENLVANGPFRLVERRINDRMRLARSETYWDRGHVALETIDVFAIESYGTLLNLYLAGELDWIDRVAPSVVSKLAGREDFHPEPYLASYFYRVNVTRPPLDVPAVRRALALAIDRRAICETIMKGGQLPNFGLVPHGMEGYAKRELPHAEPAGTTAAFERALARARALLDEAGFGPGGRAFPAIEIHLNASEAHRDVAEVVADLWRRELGIEARLSQQEWKVYLDAQRSLSFDVSRSSWIGDYPDPNTFLELFVSGGENNKTGWSNPRYDALVEAARGTVDAGERMELLAQAEGILLEELPILPIYTFASQNLVDPNLGGFHANVQDEHFPKFFFWKEPRGGAKTLRGSAPRDGPEGSPRGVAPRDRPEVSPRGVAPRDGPEVSPRGVAPRDGPEGSPRGVDR
jgi:oligopeptide transport system substrate-binding protein